MAKKQKDEMSFLDHLEDLRWHLIRATLAILIAGTAAFVFSRFIFDTIIFGPKHMDFPTYKYLCKISNYFNVESTFCLDAFPFTIQNRTMGGQFSADIWTAIYAGFVIAFPYVIYQFWKFISPGLHPNERKHSRGFILVTTLLFFIGVLFGYYVITPLSINFLGTYSVSSEITNEIDLGSYISLVRSSSLAAGFVFELQFRTGVRSDSVHSLCCIVLLIIPSLCGLYKGFTKLGAQKQDMCQLVEKKIFFCVSTYARV